MSDSVPARTRLFQVLAIALALGVGSLLVWQASRQSEPAPAPARSADDVAPAKADSAAGKVEAASAGAAEAAPSTGSPAVAGPADPKPDVVEAIAPPRPDVGNRISPTDKALYLDTSKSGDFSGLAIGLAGAAPDAGGAPDAGAAKAAPDEFEFERLDPYWETSKSGGGALFKSHELE